MSQYSDAVARHRREMTQVETDANRRMLQAYDDMIASLDTDLQGITAQIDQAHADGEPVHMDWLRRQARYTRLMDQAESSRVYFEQTGQAIITDLHGISIENGALHAAEREQILFHPSLYSPGGGADVFAGNINMPAMESLIGQTGPTSPLMGVLESHGTNATEIITRELTAGLSGKGADEIYRTIRRQLQSPVADSRLMALVRTEMMNSYRASMHQQYGQFEDEIDGWMWSAARQTRTCLACLAMDGEVFPMDQPFTQAHVNCRCSASPWPKDLYPSVRKFLQEQGSGEDYVRGLPIDQQRKMFPSADSFEAFRRGDMRLKDFVGYTDSPVWGRKVHAVSGRQAMKNGGVTPPPKPQPKAPQVMAAKAPTFKQIPHDSIDKWAESWARPWEQGLTDPQAEALAYYRSPVEEGFKPINGYLRGTIPKQNVSTFDKRAVGPIDRAIAKSQLPESVVGWRGLGDGVFDKNTQAGDLKIERGFFSASLSETEANRFVKASRQNGAKEIYLMRISLPAGTNGAYMDTLNDRGGYLSEKEVLLPRNTRYVVTKVRRSKEYTLVDVEVMP